MNLIKNLRMVLFLFFLLLSTYLIFSPLILQKSGVVVSYVDKKSDCGSIKEGSVISQVSGSFIKNVDDFEKIVKILKAGDYVSMVVDDGPGGCVVIEDGSIGIKVIDFDSRPLTLSGDVAGSDIFILKPARELNDLEMKKSKEVIDERINVLKIQDTETSIKNSELAIRTGERKEIGYLTMEGKFDVKILENLKLKDGSTKLKIGDNDYDIKLNGDKKITLNENIYEENQEFSLEGIGFKIKNITNNTVSLEAGFLTNDDITGVLRTDSSKQEFGYRFDIVFEITNESSENFGKITKRIGTVFVGQTAVLDARLIYYLDDEMIENTNTNIEFKLAGKPLEKNIFYIIGVRENLDDMKATKMKIETVLGSGKLPAEFKVISIERLESNLKNTLLYISIAVLGATTIFTIFFSYMFYKKIWVGFLNICLSMALTYGVIGVAALTRILLGAGWLIDIYSIVGFLSLAAFASLQMLLISEAAFKNKKLNVSYRGKNIMSVVGFLNLVLIILSFAILFTAWKGFGLAIMIGLFFEIVFILPMFKKIIEEIGKSF